MTTQLMARLSLILLTLVPFTAVSAPPPIVYIKIHDFGSVNAIPSSPLSRIPCGGFAGTTYGNAASDGTGSAYIINSQGNGTFSFKSIYRYDISGSPSNDGQYPYAGLALSPDGTTLYGTTQNGGANGSGALFSLNWAQATLNPNGNPSGYNLLTSFSSTANGSRSRSTLTLDETYNLLYGTLSSGGPNSAGSIFVSDLSGQILNVIPFGGSWGADPVGKLTLPHMMPAGGNHPRLQPEATTNIDLSPITLYGVTISGGSNSCGTVYRVQANGSNFMVLHTFKFSTTDGAYPQGGMVLQSNLLYGTTSSGGLNYAGTVFKLDTNGNNFQIIGNFDNSTLGGSPQGDLIRSRNTLYGTSYGGGTNGGGTVYSINTDGSNFQVLHSFSTPTANAIGNYTNSDGGWSVEGLVLADNILYGTTPYGGTNGVGTIYELILPAPPELRLTPTNKTYQASWPLYPVGYALQQSSSLVKPNWTTVNNPLTTNGLLLTTTISPPKGNAFFRLANTNGP